MDVDKITSDQKKQLKTHCDSMMKTLHIAYFLISLTATIIFIIVLEVQMQSQYPEETYRKLSIVNGTIF